MITAQAVKELRERTGAGMMSCKKALTEVDGNVDKAIELLREKGLAAAAKKSGRIASEGLVKTFINEDLKSGSIVEVNCETDFVSINKTFIDLTENAAKQAALSSASNIDELVSEKYIADSSITLKDAVTNLISKLGENMNVRRFAKLTVANGVIESYIHGGGRIGVLVKLECEKNDDSLKEIAKEVAMQIAATSPLFLNRDQVDNATFESEKEIYKVQAMNEGKPEAIAEKMVIGRIQKYYKENCLLEQPWVKDSALTITKYLQEESKKIGSPVTITEFVRFEKGEGIEKKQENFAEEVEKQMRQGK
jgi:elongation factor Ts